MNKQTFSLEPEFYGQRIDVFLTHQLSGFSRTRIQEFIKQELVFVNQKAVKPRHILKCGDEVVIVIPDEVPCAIGAEDIKLDIVYEDDDVLVLNKPCGMVVHPAAGNQSATLVNALLFHTKTLSNVSSERPGIVHRLDKETSGIMVVAKNNEAHLSLVKQFRKHSIQRRYIAFVKGKVVFKEGFIDLPIARHPFQRKKMAVSFEPNTKSAQTRYHTLKHFDEFSLLELFPHTGRTHQLRVHLSHLKHPILGDDKYGDKNSFSRLALHAKDLGFYHLHKKQFLNFSSPLPSVMQQAIGDFEVSP